MNDLTEILKYTLPVLIVGGGVIAVVILFFRLIDKRLAEQRKLKASKTTLNLRLQAFERLILFLERIEPYQLLTRFSDPRLSAQELHRNIIMGIKDEFDHNISQQLYISDKAWDLVKTAREGVVYAFNKAANDLPEKASAKDLAVKVLENKKNDAERNISLAISRLKKEVQELF
jgi:uncharacterized protein with ParB-like and HNH nuclease domain